MTKAQFEIIRGLMAYGVLSLWAMILETSAVIQHKPILVIVIDAVLSFYFFIRFLIFMRKEPV